MRVLICSAASPIKVQYMQKWLNKLITAEYQCLRAAPGNSKLLQMNYEEHKNSSPIPY